MTKKLTRAQLAGALFIFTAVFTIGTFYLLRNNKTVRETLALHSALTKGAIAQALGEAGAVEEFPTEIEMPVRGITQKVIIQYSFDADLQEEMEKLFKA